MVCKCVRAQARGGGGGGGLNHLGEKGVNRKDPSNCSCINACTYSMYSEQSTVICLHRKTTKQELTHQLGIQSQFYVML